MPSSIKRQLRWTLKESLLILTLHFINEFTNLQILCLISWMYKFYVLTKLLIRAHLYMCGWKIFHFLCFFLTHHVLITSNTPADSKKPKTNPWLILAFWTLSIVQKPGINECYTPSSEPYRVYYSMNLTNIFHVFLPFWIF
jgi:hypothetical protein